jgi:hypothetical protein
MRLFSIISSKFSVQKSSKGEIVLETFKKDLASKTQYLLLLTNLDESGPETADITAELVMFPTLDELVGSFDDGKMTISDIYISQKLRDEAAAAAQSQDTSSSSDGDGLDGFAQGCDLKVIESLEAAKGQVQKAPFSIEKTGIDTGKFVTVDEEGKTNETPFTYMSGVLTFDYTAPASDDTNGQEMTLKGDIDAAYGKNNDVTINGALRYSSPQAQDDFYIEITMSGSHPLPKKTP